MGRLKLTAVIVSALFLLAVGAVLNGWQLYFMAAALIALPIVSYALGARSARGLRCERQSPEYVREGEPVRISLRLEGRHRLVGPVEVHDTLPKWFQRLSEEEAIDRQDGTVVTASYTAMPTKRGRYQLGPAEVHLTDPLGFFSYTSRHRIFSNLVVYPSPLHITELEARLGGEFGEQQFEGTGARGSGVDFHGVRSYQPGDELRRVHWRSTARHGRLNVIEFEHSLGQDTVIAINLKQGSEIGVQPFTSLEYAAKLAAGIAEQALTQGSAVRLAYPGITGRAAMPGSGIAQFYAILESLAAMEANHRESLTDMLHREIESIERHSLVICVTPEIEAGMPDCAELLNARSVKTFLLLIKLSPELSPESERSISELASRGTGIAVVRCSASEVLAELEYQYAS